MRIWSLAELFATQADQQRNWSPRPADMTATEHEVAVNDLLQHLYEEVAELARAVRRRKHVLRDEPMRDPMTTAEHGADVAKILLSILELYGVDAELFARAFLRKTAIAQQSWEWERSELSDSRCLIVDLDGCVCDWVAGIRAYAVERGEQIEVGGLSHPGVETLKTEFVTSGGFLRLDPIPGAIPVLRRIHEEGVRIVIATARQRALQPRVHGDTMDWLARHRVSYDHIFFERDKARVVRALEPANILGAVEDRLKHALEYVAAGIHVFKMPYESDPVIDCSSIQQVTNWEEIESSLLAVSK